MGENNNINEEFKSLTSDLEIEQVFKKLTIRGQFAKAVAVLSADIYRAAREGGLPREMAVYMAKSYYDFEINPTGMYVSTDYGAQDK